MNFTAYILTLSISEFRNLKRAHNTLIRAGMDAQTAIDILLPAHSDRTTRIKRDRHERPTAVYTR
jgi:hypothetical protein